MPPSGISPGHLLVVTARSARDCCPGDAGAATERGLRGAAGGRWRRRPQPAPPPAPRRWSRELEAELVPGWPLPRQRRTGRDEHRPGRAARDAPHGAARRRASASDDRRRLAPHPAAAVAAALDAGVTRGVARDRSSSGATSIAMSWSPAPLPLRADVLAVRARGGRRARRRPRLVARARAGSAAATHGTRAASTPSPLRTPVRMRRRKQVADVQSIWDGIREGMG